jgi:PAS domain S-box-containing protein
VLDRSGHNANLASNGLCGKALSQTDDEPVKLPDLDPMLGLRLLASSPDCVKLLDLDGRLEFMSDNGLALFEIDSAHDVEGRQWSSLWPAEMYDRVEQAVQDAIAGRVGRFSGVCPTAKGAIKWWDVAVSPVSDTNGRLIYLLAVSRDVTIQKYAEQSLSAVAQRFQALADNMAQFAWMAEPTGDIFWYNQRWFDFTGTTLEDMRGWGWQKVHHPDHVARVVEKIRSCFESGEIWEDTFPLRGADGTYRWFLSRAMPIRDDNDRIVLWCGTNTDITDQRNANHRLRQLARLIELSHEAILVRSVTDGILLWNRGCEDLYGYTQAEALGRNKNELLKSRHALPFAEIERALASEGAWSGEMLRSAKDGTEVWVDCRKEVIDLGETTVILETDRDITDRRKADEVRNLLVGELNHRVKNTLAIVQSLAAQTARNSDTMEDFVAGFSSRLQGLTGAYNILTDANWSAAKLRELLQSQFEVTATDVRRIEMQGDDVFIPPQPALQLTLIVHELATNAIKHGALASPDGTIKISWHVEQAGGRKLLLSWREMGGADVQAPVAKGLGLSLIERSNRLPHITTDLVFDPEGVRCLISVELGEDAGKEPAYFNPSRKCGESAAGGVPSATQR